MAALRKHRVANPIAVRRLSVEGEPDREVVVTIGKPRPEADPSVWRCSFIVDGLPGARRRVARGVDGMQALQNAIEAARRTLVGCGLVLTCEGCARGEIGFPRPVPEYPGTGFAEKVGGYIDRELKKLFREARGKRAGRGAKEG